MHFDDDDDDDDDDGQNGIMARSAKFILQCHITQDVLHSGHFY